MTLGSLARIAARHLLAGILGLALGGWIGGLLETDGIFGITIPPPIVAAFFGLLALVSPREFTRRIVVGMPLMIAGWAVAFIEFLAGEPIRETAAAGSDPGGRHERPGGNADGAMAELAATASPFCLECGRTLAPAQLVEVRECLDCMLRGFDGMVNGEKCPHCGSSDTRRVTDRGCPECLEPVLEA